MECNALMVDVVKMAPVVQTLAPSLQDVVSQGFVCEEGCYFIKALLPERMNVTRSSFPDCTGFECFVNSVHIEDYEEENPAGQAFLFVASTFDAWQAFSSELTLVAIISADELCVVVKFYVKRFGERWLSEHLGAYPDPIMLVESSEPRSALTNRGAEEN